MEVPDSHGSMSTLNAPLTDSKSSEEGVFLGENMRRKLLSAFRWRTVTDIFSQSCCYTHLTCSKDFEADFHVATKCELLVMRSQTTQRSSGPYGQGAWERATWIASCCMARKRPAHYLQPTDGTKEVSAHGQCNVESGRQSQARFIKATATKTEKRPSIGNEDRLQRKA